MESILKRAKRTWHCLQWIFTDTMEIKDDAIIEAGSFYDKLDDFWYKITWTAWALKNNKKGGFKKHLKIKEIIKMGGWIR